MGHCYFLAAWIACHTRCGVAGMSMWVTPSGASASMTAFIDRRQRADGAGLAGALDAERIGLGRHLVGRRSRTRQIVGARHAVIHERAGQELARSAS